MKDMNKNSENNIKVMRAEEPWQRTGAHYVRIQAMARQHGISLDEEFDEHDNDCRYIVLLDNDFPIATCRMFPADDEILQIGRVVVLEEYRGKGLGRMTVLEAEAWGRELGYTKAAVDSRDVAVGFYKTLGYTEAGSGPEKNGPFVCVYMEKVL